MSSRAELIELTFTPLNSARRRLRFEPRSDGVGTHTLEEAVREGGAWRPIGQAIVEDVDLDVAASAETDGVESDGGTADTPVSICNECPTCGAVGLEERIKNHDCEAHLRRQRARWEDRR